MKALILSFVLLFAAGLFAADSPRQRLSMDFGWKFIHADPAGAPAPEFNDAAWQNVDLPHDWSILGPFDQTAPATGAGAYLPTGIGWYRKTFRVPDSARSEKISVEFDGVYENSEVFLNGHSLGKRPWGYISFVYDLTPFLNAGGDNVLAVRVDNSLQPNSRFYSGSGIYRNVWLIADDALHIPPWGTFVTTPQATADAATVQTSVQVVNQRSSPAQFNLVCALLDHEGREIASVQSSSRLDAGAQTELKPSILVAHPNLWSIDTPYLYTVRCQLQENGTAIDQYDTPVGIRSIAFDVNKGFLLNGQHVKLNGVCLHADAGCVGMAVPDGVWARRLKILKEMGCNAIRTSHNPPNPEFLDLCDQLGFCVMDESFDVWRSGKGAVNRGYNLFFTDWWQRDVTDFVRRDRNHPSVVIWSCGNEIPEQTQPGGIDILRNLVNAFHAEDPTRPVTAACDKAYAEPQSAPPEFMALLDVAGYNYVDRWRTRADQYYTPDRIAFPQRKFVGTESSSMGSLRGDYRALFAAPAAPTTSPATAGRGRGGFGGGFGRGGRPNVDPENLWKYIRTYDFVAGDFMWTGIDYLGEAVWPGKGASSGVIDMCGFPKDGYYFYQSQWTAKPVLHVFPHWNFKGMESRIVPVTCYTNCDTVELFLNGKSFGVKGYNFPREGMEERYGNLPPRSRVLHTTSDLHLSWDVPYEPGTLKAVGVSAGRIVATQEISTTGDPAAVELTADNSSPAADRRDVVHLTVRLLDSDGRPVPTAANDVTFLVDGPARLIGVDNGDPSSHDSYQANHRAAFSGLLLAILQTTDKPGPIHVTASAAGLRPAAVELLSTTTSLPASIP